MNTVAQSIASALQAQANCRKSGNTEWLNRHQAAIEWFTANQMPSGGGFDNGTTLDLARSTGERLVFTTAFHHMNEQGYDGWTEHSVTVRPAFSGFTIAVSGRDRNGIKEYIAESFHTALAATAEQGKAYPQKSA